jgi:hypothetical protein
VAASGGSLPGAGAAGVCLGEAAGLN